MDIRSTVMESVHGNKLEHITRMFASTKGPRYSEVPGGYRHRNYTPKLHKDLIKGLSGVFNIEHEVSYEILAYWGKKNDWTEFGNMVVI